MRLRYIMRLALRNLVVFKLRSILTITGVATSIGFIAFMIAFALGVQETSTNQIADIEELKVIDVTAGKSQIVSIDEETIESISQLSEVTKIYPEISVASDISYKESKINGVVYGKSKDIISLERPKLIAGKYYTDDNDINVIIINSVATQRMGVGDAASLIGQNISTKMVLRPELFSTEENLESAKIEEKSFKVIGVINEGSAPYAYVPLNVFTAMNVDHYSSMKVKVADKGLIDRVKLQIEHMGLKTSSVKDTVDQVNQFFNVFQIILVAIGAVAIFVACLGMFNTLTISLLEKTREVALMKVLGTTRKDIWKIFITESIIIGISGGLIGLAFSWVIGTFINHRVATMAQSTGNQEVVLFVFPLALIISVVIFSVFISFFTGFYPSRRAAKINPLDALRYE